MRVFRVGAGWLGGGAVGVRILIGDVREQLATLPDGSVQCCVTSPPYYGLRQYLFDGAVILRRDLDEPTKLILEKRLAEHGIKPRA